MRPQSTLCESSKLFLVRVLFLFAPTLACAEGATTFTVGEITFKCAPSPIVTLDQDYPTGRAPNNQLVANAFAIYAAVSYDTYEPRDDGSRAFRVADNHPDLKQDSRFGKTGWTFLKRTENGSGLVYDVYHYSTPDKLVVVVAYRGTDGFWNFDTFANASWVTQWLNPWDQYRQARNEFPSIVKAVASIANGKAIAFVTTGHSLGGGLAQHVAHVHPCISAVVFNSSFVTNTTLYGNYTPRITRLYEVGDKFEMITAKIKNTEDRAIYRFTVGTGYKSKGKPDPREHNMERFAAGAARMAIRCLIETKGCEIKDDAALAKVLYCQRYWGFRWQDAAFRERTTDDDTCPRPQ